MLSLELVLETSGQMMDNPLMKDRDERFFPAAEVSLAVLIDRGKAGDTGAMETLYHRFKTSFFNLARRYSRDRATAEDLLQDIFIKIFTHLEDVKTADTFPAWAYRIALNTCFSHLRDKKTETQKTVPLADLEFTIHSGKADGFESDLRRPLEDAIGALPPRLKEIFLLHDVQGFKHEEIGRMLRLSVGTSKSQLFKARLKIRSFLKDRQIGPGERQ
jgi:RNA polymerase sigma-70 factor (ECF subfamily)